MNDHVIGPLIIDAAHRIRKLKFNEYLIPAGRIQEFQKLCSDVVNINNMLTEIIQTTGFRLPPTAVQSPVRQERSLSRTPISPKSSEESPTVLNLLRDLNAAQEEELEVPSSIVHDLEDFYL